MISTSWPLLPAVPGLDWVAARRAAVDCASHGWPVAPGTYQLPGNPAWRGAPRAVGLHPIAPGTRGTTDPAQAVEWWSRRPYTPLLAVGKRSPFDAGVGAVDLPAEYGRRLLAHRSATDMGPILETPAGTWTILIRPTVRLASALTARYGAKFYARAYLPLPPAVHSGAPYRWIVSPEQAGWKLRDSVTVQTLMARHLPRRV